MSTENSGTSKSCNINPSLAGAVPDAAQSLEDSVIPITMVNTNSRPTDALNRRTEYSLNNTNRRFGIGTIINGEDNYRLVRSLTINQRNKVFLAYGENNELDVVIKFFSDAEQYLREKEIQELLMKSGGHENLLLASEFLDGQQMIISPYAKGRNLRMRQGLEGNLTISQIKEIASRILGALQYMHEQDIVHRDIKGANIVLDSYDLKNPKLIDYEFAEYSRFSQKAKKQAIPRAVGTAHYMAPEAWDGEIDPRSDIYSAGITFYRLLTGYFPFDGEDSSEILNGHLWRPVPDIRLYDPELPSSLQLVFKRALAKDPNDRHQTAAELKNALEQVEEK